MLKSEDFGQVYEPHASRLTLAKRQLISNGNERQIHSKKVVTGPEAVLALTPWFPNHPGDRHGNFVYDSVAALARLGFVVDVVAARPLVPHSLRRFHRDHLVDRFEPDSFAALRSVSLVRYASIPRNLLWRASEWSHDRRVGPALERRARVAGARLIHAHTEGEARVAVQVGRRLGLPVVVTLHGINVGPRYLGDPRRRARFASALRSADRVILVGEPLREAFRAICGRDDNFRVVHNGIDLPSRSVTPFTSPSAPIRFISVSNLEEGKGIDVTLRALALVSDAGFDWSYTVVGDGTQMAPLRALATSLGLSERVRFIGARPHGEIEGLLATADVFILPSYREAFGIAYLEAMAVGLLTIGVHGQGPSAFIEHRRTGLLVEPRSSESLRASIVELAAAREAMRVMAAAGSIRVRRDFTWDAHASHLAAVYRELL